MFSGYVGRLQNFKHDIAFNLEIGNSRMKVCVKAEHLNFLHNAEYVGKNKKLLVSLTTIKS